MLNFNKILLRIIDRLFKANPICAFIEFKFSGFYFFRQYIFLISNQLTIRIIFIIINDIIMALLKYFIIEFINSLTSFKLDNTS